MLARLRRFVTARWLGGTARRFVSGFYLAKLVIALESEPPADPFEVAELARRSRLEWPDLKAPRPIAIEVHALRETLDELEADARSTDPAALERARRAFLLAAASVKAIAEL